MEQTLSYGSWPSPISAESLVEATVGVRYPSTAGDSTYWIESRPNEDGRYVVVRRTLDGVLRDAIPAGFSARTMVHEYGGLPYTVAGETVFFTNFSDQRLYRVDAELAPAAITGEPSLPRATRYACPVAIRDGSVLVCIRERHLDDEVVNDLIALDVTGTRDPVVLASGRDFFSVPQISTDGSRIAWICWDHPNMPWDGTELFEADIEELTLSSQRLVAGGPGESVTQPRYSPDGRLHFISDRSGWWNLYRSDPDGIHAIFESECEFAGPDWEIGSSSYCFLDDSSLVVSWSEKGSSHIGVLENGAMNEVVTPFASLSYLKPNQDGVVAIVGSPTHPPAIVRIQIPDGALEMLRNSKESVIDSKYVSVPESIEFPTEEGLTAHALFYAPTSPNVVGPSSERPPLVVMSHGGPTASASSVLDYQILFWTSRGFAVVNVDYGGSTGYGRKYRERLNGKWGVVDLDDCVNAAKYLADKGHVDGDRMVIRGGSAGGYTTLCALTFRRVFAAGASYYGVADAGALARDTHKFESHYLDTLIGPWPETRLIYEERSPIFHVKELSTPMILFQGLDDKVVPPAQSEAMARALSDRGVPYAYMTFAGEQHGFRKAESITRAASAELDFYCRILGLSPADDLDPVEIHNSTALPRASTQARSGLASNSVTLTS